MKRHHLLVSLLTVGVCLIPHPAFAFGLEASVGYWWQSPSGHTQVDGDPLDLEDDFGYDTEAKPFGRIKLDLPGVFPNLYLMATPMEFEGTASRNLAFIFGGAAFAADTPFVTKAELNQYDVAMFYSLPFLEKATHGILNADLGLGLGVKIIDFKIEILQEATAISESESFTMPVPVVYAGLQFEPFERFSFEAEARAIAFSSDHYIDLIGRVKIKLIEPVFGAGGYRYQGLEFDQEGVVGSFEIQGPFVEVGVRF